MQNFPNNIVLTSLCYFKYYTMCRCLSMPVMPVKAAGFIKGAGGEAVSGTKETNQFFFSIPMWQMEKWNVCGRMTAPDDAAC